MIRANDFPAHGLWPRTPLPASYASAADAAGWFRDDMEATPARIVGDLDIASRGLSVAQHTALVLSQLCGGADDRA